jgi:hypothetical protein
MKKSLYFIVVFLLAVMSSYAQPLIGIKTIPGTYASIKDAIDALNINGVGTGGVIFNVAADYKETFTSAAAGHITTTTGSATNPITFQKSGTGAKPLITSGTGIGNMDAIFLVAGSDYVTFDGFEILDNPDNMYDETMEMEWGFAILKASGINGSQNITIRNCTITLSNWDRSSVGIYSNNHNTTSTIQLTVTSASGTNSNLKFYNNTLVSCYRGIYVKGFDDQASPYALYDQNNEIGKDGPNTITNIGGDNIIPYGIYAAGQNNLKVAYNTITSIMEGFTSVYGIYLTNSKNANFDLYNNTVSLNFSSTNPVDPGLNEQLFGIYCDMGANGSTNAANIYNNIVTNCSYPNIISAGFTGMFLYNMGVTVNVYGNVVSNSKVGSTHTEASGPIRYFWCQQASSSPGTLVAHDNVVSGNARIIPAPLSATTHLLSILGTGTSLDAYNNMVVNDTVRSSGATKCLYITYNDASGKNVHNNTVSNIMEANGSVDGLYNAFGTTGYFYNNTIQGIHASESATIATINGVNHSSGTSMYYYNNMISDLTNPAAVADPGYSYNMLNGINVEGSIGSFKGFYNNTVYLNSNALSTEFGSSAFCAMRLSELELRNNIFVNSSAASGPNGLSVGIRSREVGFAGFVSNNNDIYAGTPGPSHYIFHNGSTGYQTLAQYKSAVSPNDNQSVSTLPPFINIATTPYNLHIKTDVGTQCESGGSIIVTPIAVTTDIDGDMRFPNPGYPENASFPAINPDLGADEFGGRPVDSIPPSIVYTPLTDINNGNARTLVATIIDNSRVPVSGFGLPVLYWSKNGGAYSSTQGVFSGNDNYSFTFGAGSVLNDVIRYYVVAQDEVTPFPNVGSNPAQGVGGFSANPPACSTPPSNPYSYKVILDISGIKHIGIGKDYTTISAAAADLNLKYMAGPVTFILDDNTYPNETFPIRFNERAGNSPVNTLTIKPNTGISPVITGAVQDGIIVMNGIDFVTFDGSNNGTSGKNLTIENTLSMGGAHAFGISNHNGADPSQNITLKNCILKGNKANIVMENTVIVFNHNGGLTGGNYSNILITNNTIMKNMYGISVDAMPANPNRNITITNNLIGSPDTTNYITRGGILINNTSNVLISGNEIMGGADGTPQLFQFGIIIFGNCPNTKIHKNKIHDWYSTGWGSYGIKYSNDNSDNPPSEIFNNVIYNIKCWAVNPGVGNNPAYGIFIRRGSNLKIWHNSIYLSGPFLDGSDGYAPSSACIGVYESATVDLDIRDNILRNAMTNPANPPAGSGNEGRAYAIMFAGGTDDFSTLDQNTYYIDGYRGSIAMRWISTGGFGGFFNTLADWQAYTGKEVNSDTLNPVFTSDIDPINLVPTSLQLNSTGGPKILDTDYNNATRFTPPDRGAYEWSSVINSYHTLPATSVTQNEAVLNGDIDTKGEMVEVHFDYGLTASYGSTATPSPATVRSVGSLLPVNAELIGLLPNTTYHFRFRGTATTSVQSDVYGADMTFTTLPGVPVSTVLQNDTIRPGVTNCFNATGTISIAGSGTSFVVQNGGSATMIAGQNINYLPGTKVLAGGYMHGYISNQYCGIGNAPAVAVKTSTDEPSLVAASQNFRIYPNPSEGIFTLENSGDETAGNMSVTIYNMCGKIVYNNEQAAEKKQTISITGNPAGIYFVHVVSNGHAETVKLVLSTK